MTVWLRRVLLTIAILGVLGFVGFRVFERPIAEAAFRRAVAEIVGRDRSAELPDGLHVYVCGSGSPMPDPSRAGPCLGVIAGSRAFVFDAGSGGVRNLARMGFPVGRVERVYLTHLHSDHIDGLGETMLQAWVGGARKSPLPVSGPRGTAEVVAGFNAAYRIDSGFRIAHHGPEVADPNGFGLVAREIELPREPAARAIVLDEEGLWEKRPVGGEQRGGCRQDEGERVSPNSSWQTTANGNTTSSFLTISSRMRHRWVLPGTILVSLAATQSTIAVSLGTQ